MIQLRNAVRRLTRLSRTQTRRRTCRQLRGEWQPHTPTQEILIAEMARHAAALELVERAEPAVLRTSASAMAQLPPMTSGDLGNNTDDFLLTACLSSDAVDRVTRYRRAHEKGFHQAFQRLRELLAEPRKERQVESSAPPFVFTEPACRDYLVRRLKAPEYACPQCGHKGGSWLTTRSRWECAACGHQSGLRTGTVMERSPLPFPKWFKAIWEILIAPDTSLTDLATAAEIARPNTIHRVAEKIRAALASPNVSTLLAGLNELCGGTKIST